MRIRRDSRVTFGDMTSSYRPSFATPLASNDDITTRRRNTLRSAGQDTDDDRTPTDDRTPLLQASSNGPSPSALGQDYGMSRTRSKGVASALRRRSPSATSSRSGGRRPPIRHNSGSLMPPGSGYDVNNPPSVPPSPQFKGQEGPDDVGFTDVLSPENGPQQRGLSLGGANDVLVDIDGNAAGGQYQWPSPPGAGRMPMPGPEGDVCFPVEGMSELAEEDFLGAPGAPPPDSQEPWRRKRTRRWPDLSVLEEWSREERAERHEEIRAKKISEPVLVGGRLRANLKHAWHREEEDAPYRFTYFNEEFASTIHSQTISELLQPGQSFRELFVPDPPELSDESSDEEEEQSSQGVGTGPASAGAAGKDGAGHSRHSTRESSIQVDARTSAHTSPHTQSAAHTPPNEKAAAPAAKPKRYGARPTFWLDVLSPTEAEMRVIQRAFGIHALTAEDILLQEAREKVELFPNYYFVNYRTFEQDAASDDYLEPVDMYVVVFREGVISFHFSLCPHPANVRRRIRQLKDYRVPNADWISYAVIDDITDAFAPLIANVEKEVDDIDDAILQMHTREAASAAGGPAAAAATTTTGSGGEGLGLGASLKSMTTGLRGDDEKRSVKTDAPPAESGADMLLRVGRGRKKVMGLLRLLGNKADVIKGFAKRCNEQWEIAPRSDIGLYLGDIQDHIITMTSNLGHYETCVPFHPFVCSSPVTFDIRDAVANLDGCAGSSRAPTPTTWRRSTSA